MTTQTNKNIRLGTFVIIGTAVLIFALYLIGNKQNLFSSTIRVSARFDNVNGLMRGNNVRYAGIDVGTVESVLIINDTSVNVVMLIEKNICPFIKKNSLASVGTDGLMGNKLLNINSVKESSEPIEEGDILNSQNPIEMDAMVRTLNSTNENINVITFNLKNITEKINSKNSLWNLLLDTVIANNVKSTLINLKLSSNNAVIMTGDLKYLAKSFKNGKGIGALITDTSFTYGVNQTVIKLNRLSDSVAIIGGDISKIVRDLKMGKGSTGVLLNDTMLIYHLNKSIKNIDSSAINFNENMKALQYSWPFKKYYRKHSQRK